ncbi:MAG: decaprenyl-phosphate phosphoribosyltransferase [Ignavibacteriae bacterium]|nr:decaprenyl-phosphate phosphoribosyltransferase [Ignavibacteria bacterium]MBI3363335.1 decaprenyl-phosphate phosphoribosyltransferase [Ignavibacteriota bacterium]
MRLQQWIKNFFLFAALVFSGNLFNLVDVYRVFIGFLFFSGVASGIYIFNDIADLGNDKLHPTKSRRPLPSGKLSVRTARVASFVLLALGVFGGYILDPSFAIILAVYLVLNILYSFKLKHVVILDVMTVSAGFVLRVIAGAVLINVPTSEWLIVCTILLSLFLGFSKRRHELTILETQANTHRSVLEHYNPYFLDQMIGIVTASTVMSYTLYTISDETVRKYGTNRLIYTVPFVLYGIFRYLYLVHKRVEGGNPTKIALTDLPLLANIVLWILTASIIIYGR